MAPCAAAPWSWSTRPPSLCGPPGPGTCFLSGCASARPEPPAAGTGGRRYTSIRGIRPGELIHIDIKKLGRIGSVGHRITGRKQSPPSASVGSTSMSALTMPRGCFRAGMATQQKRPLSHSWRLVGDRTGDARAGMRLPARTCDRTTARCLIARRSPLEKFLAE